MKPFQFRLDPLLRIRRLKEDEKQRVVGELMTQISIEQQKALAMAESVRQQNEILTQQRAAGKIDLAWLAHYRRYVTHMQQLINEKIEHVKQIQKRLMIARQELAEAAKETKVLEKLKERRHQRYDRHLAMLEMRELDDLGAKQYCRKIRQEQAADLTYDLVDKN